MVKIYKNHFLEGLPQGNLKQRRPTNVHEELIRWESGYEHSKARIHFILFSFLYVCVCSCIECHKIVDKMWKCMALMVTFLWGYSLKCWSSFLEHGGKILKHLTEGWEFRIIFVESNPMSMAMDLHIAAFLFAFGRTTDGMMKIENVEAPNIKRFVNHSAGWRGT